MIHFLSSRSSRSKLPPKMRQSRIGEVRMNVYLQRSSARQRCPSERQLSGRNTILVSIRLLSIYLSVPPSENKQGQNPSLKDRLTTATTTVSTAKAGRQFFSLAGVLFLLLQAQTCYYGPFGIQVLCPFNTHVVLVASLVCLYPVKARESCN